MLTPQFATSNVTILLISLACFSLLAFAAKYGVARVDRIVSPGPSVMFWVCVVIQVSLLVGVPSYRNFTVIYLSLFLFGVGALVYVLPGFLRSGYSVLIFAPIVGLALLSIAGAYFVAFDVRMVHLPALMCVFAAATILLAYRFRKNAFIATVQWELLRSNYRRAVILSSLLITPLVIMILFPVLFSDPTSPLRVGPDMALYAKTAQYYLDGGTWTHAGLRATELGWMTPPEINRYADATLTWPEMYYFRWGLTAYQVTTTVVTFSMHSYETQFVSMAVVFMLLAGLIFFWLRNYLTMGRTSAALGFVAFALNANLLNLWLEGFYGNAFALLFFTLILLIFAHARKFEVDLRDDAGKPIILLCVLFAVILVSYPEAIAFVFSVYFVFIFLADLVYNKKVSWSPYLLLLLSGIFSVLVVLPCGFLIDWVVLAFNQITTQGGNGYQQPLWAWPAEIMGIQNIYLNTSAALLGQLLIRPAIDVAALTLISLFVLFVMGRYLLKHRLAENCLFIASVAMVAVAAIYVSIKSPQNNYTYMKMYVFHLPMLFLFFWAALNAFGSKRILSRFELPVKPAVLFAFVIISFNGALYIVQYKSEEILVAKSRMALPEELKAIDFSNVILYPTFRGQGHLILDILHRNLYPAVLPVPWIIQSQWVNQPYFRNFLHYKVYLFIEKRPGRVYKYDPGSLIFENDEYLIVNSHHTVADALSSPDGPMDVAFFADRIPIELEPARQEHNKEAGLPLDFDPATYLEINPGLVEFWESHGMHESGDVLLNHAEEHYKAFGAKDGWKYK
ncbi:MAG TPA: hypothetical protein VG737_15510 [Cyclobacteriaceae bacterium]|nr:hypothetical protein [Cyclobacteriaceae bacterium]